MRTASAANGTETSLSGHLRVIGTDASARPDFAPDAPTNVNTSGLQQTPAPQRHGTGYERLMPAF